MQATAWSRRSEPSIGRPLLGLPGSVVLEITMDAGLRTVRDAFDMAGRVREALERAGVSIGAFA